LYLSHEAEKRGLDKGPRFEESMRFRRMQALAEQLSKNLVDEANKIPDTDVEKFYNANPEAFQEAELLRVFVPKMKTTVPVKDAKTPTEGEQKANEAGMKKEADTLHTRAVAGEDFDALQKAAFTAGGLKATPPSAKLGKIRRTGLPPEHAQVFELKPGEVSAVILTQAGISSTSWSRRASAAGVSKRRDSQHTAWTKDEGCASRVSIGFDSGFERSVLRPGADGAETTQHGKTRSSEKASTEIMQPGKPTVIVTGVSGNLGQRLLPLLQEFSVIGIDLRPRRRTRRSSSRRSILEKKPRAGNCMNCSEIRSRRRSSI
jgi:hypothetical protein